LSNQPVSASRCRSLWMSTEGAEMGRSGGTSPADRASRFGSRMSSSFWARSRLYGLKSTSPSKCWNPRNACSMLFVLRWRRVR
jgi:hypothetical protein